MRSKPTTQKTKNAVDLLTLSKNSFFRYYNTAGDGGIFQKVVGEGKPSYRWVWLDNGFDQAEYQLKPCIFSDNNSYGVTWVVPVELVCVGRKVYFRDIKSEAQKRKERYTYYTSIRRGWLISQDKITGKWWYIRLGIRKGNLVVIGTQWDQPREAWVTANIGDKISQTAAKKILATRK